MDLKSISDRLGSRRATALALALAALVVASILVVPFYTSRSVPGPDGKTVSKPLTTHDMAQHLAVMSQFDLVMRTGSIYPRWQPDFNKGYGLAWTNFYQPGFFYQTSLVNLLFKDWVKTLFALSILGLAASGLTFYLLARLFYDGWASAVAALLYMLLPYHTLDLYWRGAMPELQGFILVPLILYFAFKAGAEAKAHHIAGLGLFYGLYLLTHFPVAYLLSYTLVLYALIWGFSARDWKIVLRLGVGMSLGLMLSAIYLVPASLEYKHTHEHFTTIFPYHDSYITLMPTKDAFRALLDISFIGQTMALIAALVILALLARGYDRRVESSGEASRGEATKRMQTRLMIAIGVFTTFMSTSFSIYISRLIPKIESVSFAWRWLVITGFFAALLFAAAIDRFRNHKEMSVRQKWAYGTVIALVVVLNIWITTKSIIGGALSNGPLNPPPNHIEEAFIPKGGTSPREMPDTPIAMTLPEGGIVEVVRWEPLHREVGVSNTAPAVLRLRTYNFPGWVARVDGNDAQILSDKDGAQLIPIEPGKHKVEVRFASTPPRTAGAAITILGFLIILGLIGASYYRGKRGDTGRPAEPIEQPAEETAVAG